VANSKSPVPTDGMFRWAHLRIHGIYDEKDGRSYIQDDVGSRQ
jgi:hypothetical protein